MDIKPNGTQPSARGPAEYFTGTVRIDQLFKAPKPARWHGASPTTAMTHIAVQEELDGKVVDWMEKVTDEQYDTSPRSV
jgi:quercetin dioxygenase-like cupin family protein